MKQLLILTLVIFVQYVSGERELCGNSSLKMRSCSSQILGHDSNYDTCRVEFFPQNSVECKDMLFGPIVDNKNVGGVSLKPYVWHYEYHDDFRLYNHNYTVLNITFTNIKWKTMKFRFQRYGHSIVRNHCRNIVISSDVTVNDQSVLYYDCYWSLADGNYNGQNYILDFEANGDAGVKRGQYYFNIPSGDMLSSTINIEDWKPFTYIEIHTSTLKLHILPPPTHIRVTGYRIEVMKACDKRSACEEITTNATISVKNSTKEVTYQYSLLRNVGSYYFVVTPLHDGCVNGDIECQSVRSPIIYISSEVPPTTYICIASLTSLVVATLFAYYVALRVIRRYWCKDYRLAPGKESLPPPPKILVVYSSTNKVHAECVNSFVSYLRFECGLDVMHDGDIAATVHGDPYLWANEAFRISNYVLYVISPAEENLTYHNIYDQPIMTPHRNVDALLLNLIRANRATKNPKSIANVAFEHSDGIVPIETRNDKVFYLLKDWQKLIAYLSKNLLPKQQMARTEKGRCLLEDLKRAKKLLSNRTNDVVIRCENLRPQTLEKKVLL